MTDLLADDDQLRIRLAPGNASRAIISFSGIWHAEGIVANGHDEFRRTFEGCGIDHDIYYVSDKSETWYNNGLHRRASHLLNQSILERGTTDVITIGNSMGGFAAVVFAKYIRGCRRAVSFAGQSTIAPDVVPDERRWPKHVARVQSWDVKDATEHLAPNVEYLLFAGLECPIDIVHMARLDLWGRKATRAYYIPGVSHQLAGELKSRGQLTPILEAVFCSEISAAETAISDILARPQVNRIQASLSA